MVSIVFTSIMRDERERDTHTYIFGKEKKDHFLVVLKSLLEMVMGVYV